MIAVLYLNPTPYPTPRFADAIDTSGRGSFRVVQEATDTAVAEIERLVAAKVVEIGA